MNLSYILKEYQPGTYFEVKEIKTGLINNSYSVAVPGEKPKYFLQNINTKVFDSPKLLLINYQIICKELMRTHSKFVLPQIIASVVGKLFVTDESGQVWRMFEYVNDSTTKTICQNENEAFEVAKTFGKFSSNLQQIAYNRLYQVLPDFHNLNFRSVQLKQAIASAPASHLKLASSVLNGLEEFSSLLRIYNIIEETISGFRKYVLHHDAKIANILFDKQGKVITPIDIDTTMPGYFFSDAGDMFRTMAGNTSEEEKDTDSISIRKEYYDAITDGYLTEMSKCFMPNELQHFHASGLMLCFMQCMRFATDFLGGDIYYKITYPLQNLNRAKNQLTLLRAMADHVKAYYQYRL